MAQVYYYQCETLKPELWQTLPEEIIKYITEYWCDHKERIYRHLLKIELYFLGILEFKDPTNYLRKISGLTTLQKMNKRLSKNGFDIPTVKYTAKCVILTYNDSWKNKRFNIINSRQQYINWCRGTAHKLWNDILIKLYLVVLIKKHPSIHKLILQCIDSSDNSFDLECCCKNPNALF